MTQFHSTASHPSENGESFPLGSTLFPDGVNFSLLCKNGTSVELLLFDHIDDIEPARVIPIDARKNKTYHYWHAFLPDISKGQLYAYRVHGPFEPWNGHRYDPAKILLDPYAKIVAVPEGYNRSGADFSVANSTPSMKSVVADLPLYDWEGDTHLKRPFAKTVIYEMHLGGFTRNPNSMIGPLQQKTGKQPEDLPLLYDPGTRWTYSGSTKVLGRVVERASGISLDRFNDIKVGDIIEAFTVERIAQLV